MNVRRPEDAAAASAAASIDAAVASEGWLGVQPPVDVAERARRHAAVMEAEGAGGLWVLDRDDAIVGYATLHEHTPGVLSLGMALLPDARGQGGGRALLEVLIAHGEASDAHKLTLEVWVENTPAIALYASSGFFVEGVKHDHYRRRDGRLRSSILMARRLDARAPRPASAAG